jgi:hypothetical protein
MWFRHCSQAHGQQRRQGNGQDRGHSGPGGTDDQCPAETNRGQLGTAHPERPQGTVLGGFGKAQACQQLAEDEHGNGTQKRGEQPQRHRL